MNLRPILGLALAAGTAASALAAPTTWIHRFQSFRRTFQRASSHRYPTFAASSAASMEPSRLTTPTPRRGACRGDDRRDHGQYPRRGSRQGFEGSQLLRSRQVPDDHVRRRRFGRRENKFAVDGELTIHGVTKPVTRRRGGPRRPSRMRRGTSGEGGSDDEAQSKGISVSTEHRRWWATRFRSRSTCRRCTRPEVSFPRGTGPGAAGRRLETEVRQPRVTVGPAAERPPILAVRLPSTAGR